MTNDYKKIGLGPEAINYMLQMLAEGHTLAKCLLEIIKLQRGEVFTIVPPQFDVDTESLRNFKDGPLLPEPPVTSHVKITGGYTVPIPNTDSQLAKFVQHYLQSGPGGICLFEDSSARPSDPVMSSVEIPWLGLNDEVYYFTPWQDYNFSKIEQVIRKAHTFFPGVIAAMTYLSENEESLLKEKKSHPTN
jgi:hypothetical protein